MPIPAEEYATFLTNLNQIKHEFEIYLDTGAGALVSKTRSINPNSIVNLTIEDSLANWAVRGSITLFYNPEVEDALFNNTLLQTLNSESPNIDILKSKGFNFRNDGYDLLRIRLVPKLNDSNTTDINTLNITDPVHWTLSYLFSIYDAEDIDLPPGAQNQASATIKCLKLYFWDSWYQKLISKVIQYSTANSPEANIEEETLNKAYNPGTIFTGQAIKEILTLGLSNNSTSTEYSDFSSQDKDPALKIADKLIKDNEEDKIFWDNGAAKIFYTAPAETTAYESLMYVYNKHVSSTALANGENGTPVHDISLLVKERGPTATDIGLLTLRPLTSFFEKAGNEATTPGKYQIEHFYLQSYGDETKASKMFRSPTSPNNNDDTIDFTSLKYSAITNYRTVDICALTNTVDFANKPVCSFDFNNRVFNIEFINNSVKKAREFMNEQYIKKLYRNVKADNDIFLIELNKDKEFFNTRPVFSLHGDNELLRQTDGIHKLLRTGLFQNTAINFRTLGLTNREPGRFIAIDKTEGVEQGSFEDKFFGQWFVINVRHIIESEIYYNDITAIKIHRFQNKFEEFQETI
jgi:hypothetical protein